MTTEHPAMGQLLGTRPDALAAQLRWVHDMLRRDLGSLQDLAARVTRGAGVDDIERQLHDLKTNSALFQLRANCLSYCQTLASHHGNEDALLFPAVRRMAPQLAATLDRLEADHLVVASLLAEIGELSLDLADRATRLALVRALEDLSANLLRHLDLEERAVEPILESWSAWPQEAPDEIREEIDRRGR